MRQLLPHGYRQRARLPIDDIAESPDCVSCSFCTSCKECEDSSYCTNTYDSRDCGNCTNCAGCDRCRYCTNCRGPPSFLHPHSFLQIESVHRSGPSLFYPLSLTLARLRDIPAPRPFDAIRHLSQAAISTLSLITPRLHVLLQLHILHILHLREVQHQLRALHRRTQQHELHRLHQLQ